MKKVRKAVGAIVSSIITLLIAYNLIPEQYATAEVVSGLTGAVTGFVVWALPNAKQEEK